MTPADLIRRSPLPRHENERLLAVALRVGRHEALSRSRISGPAASTFRKLVARRRTGEPLQYIEGSAPFGPIEVAVDRRVLIPRPETEELFTRLATGPAPDVIVDLCTGSGCLGLALASVFPDADVHLADASADALAVAEANALSLGSVVSLWQGDMFQALPEAVRGRVDLFACNPPYVAASALESLAPDVRDFEPTVALVAGSDGMAALRTVAAGLPSWLSPGARFGVEIGHDQGAATAALFTALGGRVERDMYGVDRFVIGATPDSARKALPFPYEPRADQRVRDVR